MFEIDIDPGSYCKSFFDLVFIHHVVRRGWQDLFMIDRKYILVLMEKLACIMNK
jgi:hypothetical protein